MAATPTTGPSGTGARDARFLRRAVALGALGRRRTAPNPWVGCVLVAADGETVVGEGTTEPPGSRHAEIVALAQAGDRARGGTAYVTLEPCAHHGRTPPCADALVVAGVARVVVALTDPDPLVAGRGVDDLRTRGLDVHLGPEEVAAEARRGLAPYLHHRRTGRALCLLKTAVSLDGRTAAADGSSRWITGEAARADAHGLRADSQAIVVGAGTALADRPALTARDASGPAVERAPLRVLLDGRGRVPADGPLFDVDLAPTLVVTTEHAPSTAVDAWRAAGAKVEVVAPDRGGDGVDLTAVLELLGRDGVLQALVEGGATVHGALLAAGLADRIVAYVGATALGPGGRPAFDHPGPATIADAPRFVLTEVTRLGGDVRLDYDVRRERE
ncbi:MAG TPA: bifunctional diaminohydroxyphosphoribosylaminopyrimidine deaminase/5-amino-6-(5-phosphoribosylamino)uracil reductase RibD [Acidimicrobiia bacterium]|nr:bifunctional diaminohydroxyphosphoribosylaminopyrimidine deaminase/5-amino-6-(5-phosphoribosylamino)uracil reductase RibD [Acidimicrobiia bacterium]